MHGPWELAETPSPESTCPGAPISSSRRFLPGTAMTGNTPAPAGDRRHPGNRCPPHQHGRGVPPGRSRLGAAVLPERKNAGETGRQPAPPPMLRRRNRSHRDQSGALEFQLHIHIIHNVNSFLPSRANRPRKTRASPCAPCPTRSTRARGTKITRVSPSAPSRGCPRGWARARPARRR